MVNTNDFFDPLRDMLERCIAGRFMREMHRDMWAFVEGPDDVLPAIANSLPGSPENRTLAALGKGRDSMETKIIGLVGSYHKSGIIDSAVDEVLAATGELGAVTEKYYLIDSRIEFCTNCRTCTQAEGIERGPCVQDDDMKTILDALDQADGIVFGAPVNFFNVNALTRKFMERLVCYTYWPWGSRFGPRFRKKRKTKRAVVITSSSMPAFMGRILTGALWSLKSCVKLLGAKPVAALYFGMVAVNKDDPLPEKLAVKARKAGRKLVS